MAGERPVYSFDLDGVLAAPPLSWNPAVNRDTGMQPSATSAAGRSRGETAFDRLLSATWYELRYVGRSVRPGAVAAVAAAAEIGDVIVLTGRSERGRRQTRRWLESAGIWPHLSALVMNATTLPSARHKEREAGRRNIIWHADDDAATAALIARCGAESALLDWPRNRGLDFPDGVKRYRDMHAVAEALRGKAEAD